MSTAAENLAFIAEELEKAGEVQLASEVDRAAFLLDPAHAASGYTFCDLVASLEQDLSAVISASSDDQQKIQIAHETQQNVKKIMTTLSSISFDSLSITDLVHVSARISALSMLVGTLRKENQ